MVIIGFSVQDKLGRARFFQDTFLITDTSMEVVFEMFFLTLNKVKVDFIERKLTWKAYTIVETLSTTKKI